MTASETACSEIAQFTVECRWLVPFSVNTLLQAAAPPAAASQGDRLYKLRSRYQFISSGGLVRAYLYSAPTYMYTGTCGMHV